MTTADPGYAALLERLPVLLCHELLVRTQLHQWAMRHPGARGDTLHRMVSYFRDEGQDVGPINRAFLKRVVVFADLVMVGTPPEEAVRATCHVTSRSDNGSPDDAGVPGHRRCCCRRLALEAAPRHRVLAGLGGEDRRQGRHPDRGVRQVASIRLYTMTKRAAFSTCTGLFPTVAVSRAARRMLDPEWTRESFERLLYPVYLIRPLSIATPLGVAAILTNVSTRLRTLAQAAFFYGQPLPASGSSVLRHPNDVRGHPSRHIDDFEARVASFLETPNLNLNRSRLLKRGSRSCNRRWRPPVACRARGTSSRKPPSTAAV